MHQDYSIFLTDTSIEDNISDKTFQPDIIATAVDQLTYLKRQNRPTLLIKLQAILQDNFPSEG